MSSIEQAIFCNGCGVEITWAPIIKGERRYCCEDCLHGRGCECATRQDMDDDRRPLSHAPSNPSQTKYL
ncbi:MAG: hypothetical protein Fur0022_49250 [Anaerolineales bacterium]